MATLGRVLDVENPTSAIVFCRTRTRRLSDEREVVSRCYIQL
jgi:hypothetical protein